MIALHSSEETVSSVSVAPRAFTLGGDLAVINSANKANVNTVGWSFYKNDEYGFSFKYPASWKIKETISKGSFRNIILSKDRYEVGFYISNPLPEAINPPLVDSETLFVYDNEIAPDIFLARSAEPGEADFGGYLFFYIYSVAGKQPIDGKITVLGSGVVNGNNRLTAQIVLPQNIQWTIVSKNEWRISGINTQIFAEADEIVSSLKFVE